MYARAETNPLAAFLFVAWPCLRVFSEAPTFVPETSQSGLLGSR
jgi:hypothetical protein